MYDNVIAQKIAFQYKQTPFLNFTSITPYTEIEELNLNWREGDSPEVERTKNVHRLHPCKGKFIPQFI